MPEIAKSPVELRSMFGANLRTLSQDCVSISDLSRRLGINRTQFNRYLAGESFPRPDVLARICDFFEVDARVLLEPVADIGKIAGPLASPFLKDSIGHAAKYVSEEVFPNGFYRFSRRSFVDNSKFLSGLVHITRNGSNTYLRGYESKVAMRSQGLNVDSQTREFRGLVLQVEDGIGAIVSRRAGLTASFNFLSRAISIQNNFWVGYVSRTVRENAESERITRLVYEHLGNDMTKVLTAARQAGLCTQKELLPYHQRLLQIGDPFR